MTDLPFEASWLWIVGGLIVAGCELVAPGVFLIWLGLAAVATGLLVTLLAVSWQVQVVLFAALAVVAVLLGRRVSRGNGPDLNRRGHDLVGRSFVLDEPVSGGVGRLRLGDTTWHITGPDLPAGSTIRVVALDGSTLQVTAV